MKINLRDGILWLGDFALNADEIYSVVFEGSETLRGEQVSREDFIATGIQFQSHTLVPVLRLNLKNTHTGPLIRCRLAAIEGESVADGAVLLGNPLGYAINNDSWVSFPKDAAEEACKTVSSLGAEVPGMLTLKQYFSLIRLPSEVYQVKDETGQQLSAPAVASSLESSTPDGFCGKLFPYQEQGVSWLNFMYRQRLGGLLADEMGLGKSVQVVCLVLQAKNCGGGMSLVIAPATLLENWRREFAKFAPSLNVMVHRGARRTGLADGFKGSDVVVTSFETAVSDVSLFAPLDWNMVVVDEAQGIKNPDARRTICLKRIRRKFALAVTGTPVENSLRDLWSIMDFAVPSFLGSLSEFERNHPDSLDGATLVEPRVSPLILRRRVTDVAQDLPGRIEVPVALEIDDNGARAYESIRQEILDKYGRVANLVAITRLRLFCAHPWAADSMKEISDPLSCSPKLKRTFEIMEEVAACGDKALIFCAFSEVIDLVYSVMIRKLALPAWILDGRVPVPERQKIVDDFSNVQGTAVLVMNPRAAGVGLNITAATHVIHYTPEWNPALADQASARAYRRGQTRLVRIYRLYFADTVEEVMEDRMASKRGLAESAIIGTAGGQVEFDDLMRAISLTPQTKL
jgi:SNF2 family DNA or RNA helicase